METHINTRFCTITKVFINISQNCQMLNKQLMCQLKNWQKEDLKQELYNQKSFEARYLTVFLFSSVTGIFLLVPYQNISVFLSYLHALVWEDIHKNIVNRNVICWCVISGSTPLMTSQIQQIIFAVNLHPLALHHFSLLWEPYMKRWVSKSKYRLEFVLDFSVCMLLCEWHLKELYYG